MIPLETSSVVTLGIAIIALISAVTVGYFTYKGGRFAVRQGIQANTETRAEVWNAGYRTAAEEHLQYDADRVADIRQLRDVVNKLEAQLNLDLTKFEPIPKAPALFPKLEK